MIMTKEQIIEKIKKEALVAVVRAESPEQAKKITEACSFIAPVTAYPGEFEMEAMAAGAIRVLDGEESLKKYTGKKVFEKFDFEP